MVLPGRGEPIPGVLPAQPKFVGRPESSNQQSVELGRGGPLRQFSKQNLSDPLQRDVTGNKKEKFFLGNGVEALEADL